METGGEMTTGESISIGLTLAGIGIGLLIANRKLMAIPFMASGSLAVALATLEAWRAIVAVVVVLTLAIGTAAVEAHSHLRRRKVITKLERCRLLANGWMLALSLATWNPRPGDELDRLFSGIQRWERETEEVIRENLGEEAVFRFRNHDGLANPDLTEIARRPESDWAKRVHFGRLRISEFQRELGYPRLAPKRPVEL